MGMSVCMYEFMQSVITNNIFKDLGLMAMEKIQ